MKSRILCFFLCLSCLGLSAQKLQVGGSLAPDFDYFRGQRLSYGLDYYLRLGAFVEVKPVERIGLRGGLFPHFYGATYLGTGSPFGPSIEQFSRLDLDISAELRYYVVEISQVTIVGIAGILIPANVYERVFYFNQAGGQRNGINFFVPEILIGPGITWNSGRKFNTYVEAVYRRGLNSFEPFSIGTVDIRVGLSWDILGKN